MLKPTVRDLALYAAKLTRTCPEDVLGKSRFKEHVRPRHAAMLVAHRNGAGYAHIGRQLGTDHSTVMTAIRRSTQKLLNDPAFGYVVDALSRMGEE